MVLKNMVIVFYFFFYLEMVVVFGLDLLFLLWLFRLLEWIFVSFICINKISNKELMKVEFLLGIKILRKIKFF